MRTHNIKLWRTRALLSSSFSRVLYFIAIIKLIKHFFHTHTLMEEEENAEGSERE